MTNTTEHHAEALNTIWRSQQELYQRIFDALCEMNSDFAGFALQLDCVMVGSVDLTLSNQAQGVLRWAENPINLYVHYMVATGTPLSQEQYLKLIGSVLEALDLNSTMLRGAEIEYLVTWAREDLTIETAEILWPNAIIGTQPGAVENDPAIQAAFENCPSPALVEVAVTRARQRAETEAQQEALQERAGGVMSLLAGVVDTNRAEAMTRQHLAANPAS